MIQETLFKNLKPILEEMGYELNEVKYLKENGNMTLHVVVDRVEPISLDDIVKVSDRVSSYLDEVDLINETYFLDVSSLGAEKPIELSKLGDYVGKYVNLHLISPYKGENYLEGTLKEVNEDIKLEIQIKANKKIISLEKTNVDKARLAIKF